MADTGKLGQSVLEDARVLYEFHSTDSGEVTADVILAAGSHDLRVADRAAELFLRGAAPLIVCSGGFGKVTGGLWDRPEGAVFAARCEELGVPADKVVVEPTAANSGENFTRSRELLHASGIRVSNGIIVSKPYMARRAWATGSKQWPEVQWYVRPPKISFESYPTNEVPLERMINLMVGDLQRLKIYAERGLQVPVEVPPPVWESYRRLKDAGYTEFVIG